MWKFYCTVVALFLVRATWAKVPMKIISVIDNRPMTEDGNFEKKAAKENDFEAEIVSDGKSSPKWKIFNSSNQILYIDGSSLKWAKGKEEKGVLWTYTLADGDGGTISDTKGNCFFRENYTVELRKCPQKIEEADDNYMFFVEMKKNPKSIEKCRRMLKDEKGKTEKEKDEKGKTEKEKEKEKEKDEKDQAEKEKEKEKGEKSPEKLGDDDNIEAEEAVSQEDGESGDKDEKPKKAKKGDSNKYSPEKEARPNDKEPSPGQENVKKEKAPKKKSLPGKKKSKKEDVYGSEEQEKEPEKASRDGQKPSKKTAASVPPKAASSPPVAQTPAGQAGRQKYAEAGSGAAPQHGGQGTPGPYPPQEGQVDNADNNVENFLTMLGELLEKFQNTRSQPQA